MLLLLSFQVTGKNTIFTFAHLVKPSCGYVMDYVYGETIFLSYVEYVFPFMPFYFLEDGQTRVTETSRGFNDVIYKHFLTF
jgi:hypothetical protein